MEVVLVKVCSNVAVADAASMRFGLDRMFLRARVVSKHAGRHARAVTCINSCHSWLIVFAPHTNTPRLFYSVATLWFALHMLSTSGYPTRRPRAIAQ